MHKPELKFKEFETYKAVYCTLCKNLKKNYGLISTFALNYECTFLVLFELGINENCPCFEKCRCAVNPFKKCNRCVSGESEFDFASAATIILTYYKILDAIEDNKFFKSLGYRFIKLFFNRKFKKAGNEYPDVKNIAKTYIEEQRRVESEKNITIDKAADPTAKMLGSLFACANKEDADKFSRFGYCLGRWIYLIDAFDDIDDDAKKGIFNVFLSNANGKNICDLKQYAFGVLNFTLGEIVNEFEKIKLYHFESILNNIIRDGMSQAQENAAKESEE